MTTACSKRKLLGIVGGMGPLASAEFLKTIYEYSIGECEQESPLIAMYSDPTFPDRTGRFQEGSFDDLVARLTEAVRHLCNLGASRIVICCFTIHYLVPRLPDHLRAKIWSLIDVALSNVVESRSKHLLVCSNGSRRSQVFQEHNMWSAAKEFIVLPDDDDQNVIHRLIYEIKANHDIDDLIAPFKSLLSKYAINSFLAGCTEFHLLAKRLAVIEQPGNGSVCIDPLTIIAREMAKDPK